MLIDIPNYVCESDCLNTTSQYAKDSNCDLRLIPKDIHVHFVQSPIL